MKRILRIMILMSTTIVFFACSAGTRATTDPDAEPPFVDSNTTQEPDDDYKVFLPLVTKAPPSGSLTISDLSDNRHDYTGSQVPTFEKFEITFQIEGSVAGNYQFPFDSSPPPGIDPQSPVYQGISVDALFTPDGWNTVYAQPAFYYQEFTDEVQGNNEWFYPTDQYAWKARFAPHQPGEWQYKLIAQDASGSAETPSQTFTVSDSANPGFIRVSQSDPRYFEFDNGAYFPALGYNLNYDGISWTNPTLDNQDNFRTMSQNGIQLARFWLSQWGIFTSAWNPWYSIAPVPSDGYIPFTGMNASGANTAAGSETAMIVNHNFDPCMFIGWMKAPPAVKPNTDYRVRVRYLTENINGPRLGGSPYGLVAKVGGAENGGWLWGPGLNCNDPGTGIVVTNYASENTVDQADPWQTIEGTWNSGNRRFLPFFYLAMENVNQGRARIDYVWIEEDLGGGAFGPNIVSKPWMSHHLYFEQRNSYAMDKVIELAHETNIYLRPVLLEKNEWAMNRLLPDGSLLDAPPDNNNFYGEWRAMTKSRWLQRAWWRYVQARWGYSPNIHSWELLNEGDPASDRHYTQADELGKFMHCEVFRVMIGSGEGESCAYEHPNAHLVSTSLWHSFPAEAFWANPNYPNIDFADVHAYISTGWMQDPAHEGDAAAYHLDYSAATRARLQAASGNRPTKPIVRGEAGLDFVNEQREQPDLANDQDGVWVHNFLWSTLDPGALIELYWWGENIATRPGPDGQPGLHEVFAYFHDFVADIPLNNGNYQDAAAVASNPEMRLTGQIDQVNQRAHLWVQNKNHTWRNVVDLLPGISGLSGNITIQGFSPNQSYPLEWHLFTTQGAPTISSTQVSADSNGVLVIPLPTDPAITDAGIKIGEY